MKIIPKILKYGDRAVDLAKFTIKVGKTKLKIVTGKISDQNRS